MLPSHENQPDLDRIAGEVNPGMFFRAKAEIDIGDQVSSYTEQNGHPGVIPAGMTLMVSEVRLVDNAPHTIIFRPHPDWVRFYSGKNWSATLEIRFLLQDFISNFEYEPNGEEIRKRELEAAQGRIQDIQEEMRMLLENPAEMQRRFLISMQKDGRTLPAVIHPTNIPSSMSEALSGSVEEFQHKVEAGRDMVQFAADQMTEVASRLNAAVSAVAPYYQESAEVSIARVSDSIAHANKITDGVRSMDLWLGNGVEVIPVTKGAPASSAAPLVLYQRLMYVASEMAVVQDVDQKFSVLDFDDFLKSLKAHPELIEQILPAERSVAALATRADAVDLGDNISTTIINQENRHTFLMARNGANVYLIFSPLWQHKALPHLFPSLDELNEIYRSHSGQEITFKDLSYTDALKAHERMATTYRRLLVLLGGLQFRERLFGNLCDPMEAINIVTQEFSNRYLHFVYDEQGNTLIGDKESLTARYSLHSYFAQGNGLTVPGSDVLIDTAAQINDKTAPSVAEPTSHSFYLRTRPLVPYVRGPVQRALRQGRHVLRLTAPFCNGKQCTIMLDNRLTGGNDYNFKMGWINLDAFHPEELTQYLMHRETRDRHWDSYTALFKQAIATMEKRDRAEAPILEVWRTQYKGAISDAALRELQRLWHIANPSKILPEPSVKTKGAQSFKRLIEQYITAISGMRDIREALAARWEELIRISLSPEGEVAIWSTKAEQERDNRIMEDAEVHCRLESVDNPPSSTRLPETVVGTMTIFNDAGLDKHWVAKGLEASWTNAEKCLLHDALKLDWTDALRDLLKYAGWHGERALEEKMSPELKETGWTGFGALVGYAHGKMQPRWSDQKVEPAIAAIIAKATIYDCAELRLVPLENLNRIIYEDNGKPIAIALLNNLVISNTRSLKVEEIPAFLESKDFKKMLDGLEFSTEMPEPPRSKPSPHF